MSAEPESDAVLDVIDIHKTFRIYHSRDLKSALLRLLTGKQVSERRTVLRGVSFSIRPGERVGLIGRNGSGKSTLLRLISRILRADSGEVKLRGRVAPLVELTAGLHPDLTGAENLHLNGAVLGLTRKQIRERFDDIIAFAELEDFVETPVRYYSSGMKARLGFSIAVHVDADVVLIDEALAVGDAAFQRRCVAKMRAVADAGAAVVFVSHEQEALDSFCSRIVWLEDGRVKLDDEPSVVSRAFHEALEQPRPATP